MVQNLRSRLSQAAAYPGLGIFTRSSFRMHDIDKHRRSEQEHTGKPQKSMRAEW